MNNNTSKFMINFLVDWELMNAEEELKRIKERQKEGIAATKLKGRHLGRPRATYPKDFKKVYDE